MNIMLEKEQDLKLELILAFKDVKKAQEAYDFIMGEKGRSANCIDVETDYPKLYYKMSDGNRVPVGQNFEKDNCVGIAVDAGIARFTVCLNEFYSKLCANEDNTGEEAFYKDIYESQCDFDGVGNTEHLKRIGLADGIRLKEGEYIPAIDELQVIYMFLVRINDALEKAGGKPIRRGAYWSSSEGSSVDARVLSFSYGGRWDVAKVASKYWVRPCTAF